jgi:hypothetical protein
MHHCRPMENGEQAQVLRGDDRPCVDVRGIHLRCSVFSLDHFQASALIMT